MDHGPDPTRPGRQVLPEAQGQVAQGWRDRWPALATLTTESPPDGPGLYFLIKSETIIYVGSSDYPSRRVWTHAGCKRKEFDHEVYLSVPPPDDLLEAERYWIRTICPKHNKQVNPCPDPAEEGWGQNPDYFLIRLPASTGHLLRLIQAATSRAMSVEAQIAIERRALSLGLRFTAKFPADIHDPKPPPR